MQPHNIHRPRSDAYRRSIQILENLIGYVRRVNPHSPRCGRASRNVVLVVGHSAFAVSDSLELVPLSPPSSSNGAPRRTSEWPESHPLRYRALSAGCLSLCGRSSAIFLLRSQNTLIVILRRTMRFAIRISLRLLAVLSVAPSFWGCRNNDDSCALQSKLWLDALLQYLPI